MVLVDVKPSLMRTVDAIGSVLQLSPFTNRSCQVLEDSDGSVPVDAGVSDTDSFLQPSRAFGRYLLIALVDVGLDHHADNSSLALTNLVSDDLGDLWLVAMVFVRIACRIQYFQ
jgi:hypothetical protein